MIDFPSFVIVIGKKAALIILTDGEASDGDIIGEIQIRRVSQSHLNSDTHVLSGTIASTAPAFTVYFTVIRLHWRMPAVRSNDLINLYCIVLSATMRPLEQLPVWVVIRLCTDEDRMVNYWNGIDSEIELNMDVIDDPLGEAEEIHRWV